MVDTPPLKHFMFVIILLGVFALLIMLMPLCLLATSEEYRQQQIPPEFEAMDLEVYGGKYFMNITSSVFMDDWGKEETGHDMKFKANVSPHQITNKHGYKLWDLFWTGGHTMEWLNENKTSRGEILTDEEIDLDYDNETGLAEYTVKCEHFYMVAGIHYNSTAFNCSKYAWDNYDSEPFNGLSVAFGIEFDEMGTTLSAWNLIGMMLFFQVPKGIEYPYNFLISLPIWVCEAFLIFAFIVVVVSLLPFT